MKINVTSEKGKGYYKAIEIKSDGILGIIVNKKELFEVLEKIIDFRISGIHINWCYVEDDIDYFSLDLDGKVFYNYKKYFDKSLEKAKKLKKVYEKIEKKYNLKVKK